MRKRSARSARHSHLWSAPVATLDSVDSREAAAIGRPFLAGDPPRPRQEAGSGLKALGAI